MSDEKLKVLFVDDEPNILNAFKRQLRGKINLDTATGSLKALDIINSSQEYAVVISDMTMPEMNGVEFLEEVKKISPNTVRVMLTGNADQGTAVKAVNQSGIFRFLTKPCSVEDITVAISAAIQQYKLITNEKELLQNTLNGSVKLLTDILSLVEPDSFGNAINYRKPIREISMVLGMTTSWDIELAMMLSDLGKILYPTTLKAKLIKNEELSVEERSVIERVPETGRNLISNIPRLEKVSEAIYYSNKNFDGTGFPNDNVKGTEINPIARIVKALKDYDYFLNKFNDKYKAVEELQKNSTKYDPEILEILLELFTPIKQDVEKVEEKENFEINIEQLCPGQIILADIKTNDDILLVKSGAMITKSMIEKIKNYGKIAGIKLPLKVNCLIPTN